MNKLFFTVDVFKKAVCIFEFSSLTVHYEKTLVSEFTFDDIIYMTEDYIKGKYRQKMQEICDLMLEKIDMKKSENQKVTDLKDQLESEFGGNILANICLSILFRTYQAQRNDLIHLGIVNAFIDGISQKLTSQAKSKVESKFKELTNAMDILVKSSENNFQQVPESTFMSDNGYIFECNKRQISMLYSLNESIDPLIHIFLTNLFIGNLKVFTCKNCRKRYFSNTDVGYCPDIKCQEEKDKEIRKKNRMNRKKNEYTNLSDTFSNYTRQLKHKLTLIGVPEDIIAVYDAEKSSCLYNVKMQISTYQDCEKPIDDDLISYIEEQKGHIKALYDSLSKQKGTEQ